MPVISYFPDNKSPRVNFSISAFDKGLPDFVIISLSLVPPLALSLSISDGDTVVQNFALNSSSVTLPLLSVSANREAKFKA